MSIKQAEVLLRNGYDIGIGAHLSAGVGFDRPAEKSTIRGRGDRWAIKTARMLAFCRHILSGSHRHGMGPRPREPWSKPRRIAGMAAAAALIGAFTSGCGFSTQIRPEWFEACRDLDQIVPTQPDAASAPSVVFEEPGSLKVMWGVTQATFSGEVLRVEQSADLPPYANQATVVLNGWQAAYTDSDHHLYDVGAILGRIQVIPGQKITWNALGDLADFDSKEQFRWTYRYTVIAWNDAAIHAMIDHNDAEVFCRTGDAHGGDNFFQAENTDTPETNTALSSFASFLLNPGFAGGREVAVLPRGFAFSSRYIDHHLLQLGYNLEGVAPFVRGQPYHKATKLLDPLQNSAGAIANAEFASWKTSAILKDNSRRHDYDFVEFVSGMGGADVEIIEPEFVLLPREDVDASIVGGGAGGGLKSFEVAIENLPFLCAVPLLTGWDIGYTPPGEGDQHVKELGIWIDTIRYERPPGSPTGTLRYTVSSILVDKDAFPDNAFRHKVTILGLKPTAAAVSPAPPAPRIE